jgi:CHAT domain-containing protein
LELDPFSFIPASTVSERGLKSGAVVVLSACDTARSKISMEFGVPGLSHAFLRAGATTVVSSLWKVPDVAAYLLMSKFYEMLFHSSAGADIADALGAAQQWVRDLDVEEAIKYPSQSTNPNWADLIKGELEKSKRFAFPLGEESIGPLRHFHRHPDLSKPFSNPFYWAGFMVTGDCRARGRS